MTDEDITNKRTSGIGGFIGLVIFGLIGLFGGVFGVLAGVIAGVVIGDLIERRIINS